MKFRVSVQPLFIELTKIPAAGAYALSFLVVFLCTYFLVSLQHFVANWDHLKRGPAFISFYIVAIAVSTMLGGRKAGFLSIVLSVLCANYFLISPGRFATNPTAMNIILISIVVIVGGLVVYGMVALRNNTRLLVQNTELLKTEQLRANHEAVLNKIGESLRNANVPEQVQDIAVESLGKALQADGCYFIRFNLQHKSAIVDHYWRQDGRKESEVVFTASDLASGMQLLVNSGNSVSYSDSKTDPFLRVLSNHLESLGGQAGIIVPLFSNYRIESALVVVMFNTPRHWEASDVKLVENVAAQSRTAADALRLQYKERNIANQLQAALQPRLSLVIPGIDTASFYRAALDEANVGGDFYDGFAIGPTKFAFVIGDVSGKGLAAASQVSAIRNMLRCLLQTIGRLDEAVSLLNSVLITQKLLPAFATMSVAIIDSTSLSLEFLSCGHEPGLLYRSKQDGGVELLEATGPVIGIGELTDDVGSEFQFTSTIYTLEPGDALLFYTDGICDAGVDVGHMIGVGGITNLFTSFFSEMSSDTPPESRTAAKLLEHCMSLTERYAHGVLRDDVCLLAILIKRSAEQSKEHQMEHYQTSRERVNSQGSESEAEQLTSVAELLRNTTGGKVTIVANSDQLPSHLSSSSGPIDLGVGENIRTLRRSVRDAAKLSEISEERADALEQAVGEAANNSLIHGIGGMGQVTWNDSGQLQIKVWDNGPGIPIHLLPLALLERGYTTTGTLGQGFKIILDSVDKCWITTGVSGTTVLIEESGRVHA